MIKLPIFLPYLVLIPTYQMPIAIWNAKAFGIFGIATNTYQWWLLYAGCVPFIDDQWWLIKSTLIKLSMMLASLHPPKPPSFASHIGLRLLAKGWAIPWQLICRESGKSWGSTGCACVVLCKHVLYITHGTYTQPFAMSFMSMYLVPWSIIYINIHIFNYVISGIFISTNLYPCAYMLCCKPWYHAHLYPLHPIYIKWCYATCIVHVSGTMWYVYYHLLW